MGRLRFNSAPPTDRVRTSDLKVFGPNLVQADPESVAIEVRVLPSLSRFSGVLDARLPWRSTGWRRRGVFLIAEMFVLQNVIGVLPLKISRNWRHDGSVDGKHQRFHLRTG